MKKYILVLFLLVFIPIRGYAGRGCCSHHRGVCGCSSDGRTICCDNTLSPSCRCTPPRVNGCTDSKADNYNPNANHNDGSCKYTIKGCTDKKANNYNSKATTNDGSCKYDVYGCTDNNAENYNIKANKDDGSCVYKKEEIFTEEKNDTVIKEENIKNDEDTINDKKRVIKTDNDTGTELFYVTTFLGLCGYGVKKLVSKK